MNSLSEGQPLNDKIPFLLELKIMFGTVNERNARRDVPLFGAKASILHTVPYVIEFRGVKSSQERSNELVHDIP